MDVRAVLEDFHDFLAPKLDTYEQAVYLYVFRHGRLQGQEEVVIGFKSARRNMALGIGERGKAMSEGTCYEKLRSLEAKGCLVNLGSERAGTRIRLHLPSEIPGIVPMAVAARELSLEEMDFFAEPGNRAAILRREGNRCFYCLRNLTDENYVIEHIVSRPDGDNSYRNLVAACRACNNAKGETPATDFLRSLYRVAKLSDADFESRLVILTETQTGERRPSLETEA